MIITNLLQMAKKTFIHKKKTTSAAEFIENRPVQVDLTISPSKIPTVQILWNIIHIWSD